MERLLKDIVFGNTEGDIAVSYALGNTLKDMVENLDKDSLPTETIDIKLFINGKEYNHELFFEHLSEHYFKYLQKQAKNIIKDDVLTALNNLTNVVNNASNRIECVADNIDYEMQLLKNTNSNF